MIGRERPPTTLKVALRIKVPKALPSLTPHDPFSALSAGNRPTTRLRPVCPGKRAVLPDSRTSDRTAQVFLFSPRTVGLPRTRVGLVLAPIKVRGRTGSLGKSHSVREIGLKRPETPSFPRGEEGGWSCRAREEGLSVFPSESTSAEVSFGG